MNCRVLPSFWAAVTVHLAVARIPVGGLDLVAEADVLLEVVLAGGFDDVFADARAVGDGLGFFPGFEVVAEGVHVAVRPDAGVAEQVPGAADGVAAFEDGEIEAGAIALQMHGGADAGQAGADDEDVVVGGGHVCAPA